MNNLQKLELISIIGRELQERMTFDEIDAYFETYGVPTDHQPSYNSKHVYVKEVLPSVNEAIVLQMASELEIEHPAVSKTFAFNDDDVTFWKPGHFRLFISHLASFKKTIGYLKKELEKYGISSFVAHEDIEPTKEWQDEIEKGLFTMDALCAVLMPGFKKSNWTDQEVGVAIGRDVLVIPIRRDLDPYGFIGKYQGFQASGKGVKEVAHGIFSIISINTKTRNKYINNIIELLLISGSVIQGIERLEAIKQIPNVPKDKIEYLRDRIVENKILKNIRFLKIFNEIAFKHGLSGLTIKSFDKHVEEDYDDLPF